MNEVVEHPKLGVMCPNCGTYHDDKAAANDREQAAYLRSICQAFDPRRPCAKCGLPVGRLSLGGPTICPRCDCGEAIDAGKLQEANDDFDKGRGIPLEELKAGMGAAGRPPGLGLYPAPETLPRTVYVREGDWEEEDKQRALFLYREPAGCLWDANGEARVGVYELTHVARVSGKVSMKPV